MYGVQRRVLSVRGSARRAVARVGVAFFLVTGACLALGGTALAALVNFQATIEQAQETPPNGSPSVWSGTFQLDTATGMVSFNIVQTGPPLGSAELFSHVHKGAIGVAGPIEFGLPNGTPKVGVYGPLTAAKMTDMMNGLHYANIHSMMFGAGEVRGQILPTGLLPLDHYQCYKIKKDAIAFPPTANAADQFGSTVVNIKKAFLWCNPVSKNGEPIANNADHLLCYKIKGPSLVPTVHLASLNQFGMQTLFAKKPFVLCVPGDKTIIP